MYENRNPKGIPSSKVVTLFCTPDGITAFSIGNA